jgi:hypothetical protein
MVGVGAVLIKNYASLDKNEKKFHLFFLKNANYQSTRKILDVLIGMKRIQRGTNEETKWNRRENRNPPPSPILSNSLFIKIDPCGIEFAMMLLRPHDYSDIVTRGHNLCVPLQSKNCEFAASGGENCLAANKKLP